MDKLWAIIVSFQRYARPSFYIIELGTSHGVRSSERVHFDGVIEKRNNILS